MGNAQSATGGGASGAAAAATAAAAQGDGPSSSSACPVLRRDGTAQQQQSACPVPESARGRAVYNVYGERIDTPRAGDGGRDPLAALRDSDVLDPKNNMPLAPNQQPCPGQRRLLSTERMESTIPKGGTTETWVYPSPQMFFNGAFRAGAAPPASPPPARSPRTTFNALAAWRCAAPLF